MQEKGQAVPEKGQHVWLHARKSRALGDPDDPKLLATHLAILHGLAAADGATVPPAHIVTEVESGEHLAARPDFRRLLELWEALPEGAGGVLYTMAIDRLSRGDPLERARILLALQRAAILIRTPGGTINLSDPDENLLAGIRSLLAEHELKRFKARVAATRAQKLKEGRVPWLSAPYGYTWDKNTAAPLPHPEQFPVLAACCREVLTTSLRRLSARYGIPLTNLRRALHHPVICGYASKRHAVQHSSVGRRVPLLPLGQWVWADKQGDWPAACTRGEWEAIQRVLSHRWTHKERPAGEEGWCRDVLRFRSAPPGAWVRLQHCGGKPCYVAVDPATKEPCTWIRRDGVHVTVGRWLQSALSRPETLAGHYTAWRAAREAEAAESAHLTPPAALRQEIEVRRSELVRVERRAASLEDDEGLAANMAVQEEIKREIQLLRRRLSRRDDAPAAPDLAPLLAEMAALAPGFEAAWARTPGGLKRRIAQALLREVPVITDGSPRRQGWRRELGAPVWQEWVPVSE